MRPNAGVWPNLSMTQETEPYGSEWRSDGTVARSWPVATIQQRNNAKRNSLESQLTSLVLWLTDQAALADQLALIISARVENDRKSGGGWSFSVGIRRRSALSNWLSSPITT
jgi:outer membrane receptor for ferrienterochelin and colicin